MPPLKSWRSSLSTLLHTLNLIRFATAGHFPLPIVKKDVAILGGGASGTYAAVRLKEDYKKSVLLIEMEPVLGGHANTYIIPETGEAFNYGVQSYIDYKGAKAFFERFDIPLQPNVLFLSSNVNVDPDTGKIDTNVPPSPPITSSIAALQKYLDVIVGWNDLVLPGYWNFPSGDQIPPDLLLPFPEFVSKYGIADMAPILAVVSGIDINTPFPTMYVVKNFGSPVVLGFLNNTFFDPLPFNNSLLYEKAGHLLGDDVKLTSTVVEAVRSNNGVRLTVEDHRTGARTLVLAKRLLVASEPSVSNLAVLGLDKQEEAVFSQWAYGPFFTAVLKTNLIPDNTSVSLMAPANSTTGAKPYGLNIVWNGVSGYFWILFGPGETLNGDEAKEAILAQMKILAGSGDFPPIGSNIASSEVVSISNHSGVSWGFSAQQYKAGIVHDLYALQGHKDTWYTGGSWCPDYSSNVWAFTDTILPKLCEAMV